MCTASNLISVLVGVTYAAHFDCMVYRCQWVCKRIAAPRPDSRHNVQELKESTVQSVIFVNVSAFIRCIELYSVISIYDAYEFQIHLPRKSRCNSMFGQTQCYHPIGYQSCVVYPSYPTNSGIYLSKFLPRCWISILAPCQSTTALSCHPCTTSSPDNKKVVCLHS